MYFLRVVRVFLKSLNCLVRVEWIEVSFGSCHEFCSRTVSGQTPIGGMIEEQSVQSASVKGSMKSSNCVVDASVTSSVPIIKEGSESPGMSELVDLLSNVGISTTFPSERWMRQSMKESNTSRQSWSPSDLEFLSKMSFRRIALDLMSVQPRMCPDKVAIQ